MNRKEQPVSLQRIAELEAQVRTLEAKVKALEASVNRIGNASFGFGASVRLGPVVRAERMRERGES